MLLNHNTWMIYQLEIYMTILNIILHMCVYAFPVIIVIYRDIMNLHWIII